MTTEEERGQIRAQIQHVTSQRFLAAYLSAVGSNISQGEKKARKMGRQAGVAAMKFAAKDMQCEHEAFGEACQEELNQIMQEAMAAQEADSSILVPESHAENGKSNIITLN